MPKKSVSYLNRIFMRILCIVLLVGIVVPMMKFMQVDESTYKPYLYFAVTLLIFSAFLHKKGGDLIRDT